MKYLSSESIVCMQAETQLYLVPTPIGNLEDMTFRAVKVLNSVDTILSEDTRKSKILLNHYKITKQLQSYHAYNEHQQLMSLVGRLQSGEKMALISDAGTPAISDPGYLLTREALKAGIRVECLPGATAFVPALVKSGLPADKFVFEGFLPHKKGRKTRLELLSEEERTMIFYESPYRLMKALEQFSEHFGPDREASVSRELTKIYEETVNGTLEELIHYYSQHTIKGEIVIVVAGKK